VEFVANLNDRGRAVTTLAGGKGAALGELIRSGMPVPPGFVILASAFENVIAAAGIGSDVDTILQALDPDDLRDIENASAKLTSLILEAEIPSNIACEVEEFFNDLGADRVAVRSSATAEDGASAAWAGQLDTFLSTTRQTLLRHIKRCWASLFTARAISYRFEKGFDRQSIGVAVVVQKMIRSDVSGTAFSVHPVTRNQNQLVIEAVYGLGEGLVSGEITPDSYLIDKRDRVILDITIANQARMLAAKEMGDIAWVGIPEDKQTHPKLSGRQIVEIAGLVIEIENRCQFACDVEWAMAQSEIYITQSRPITTLSR
jgi:pyruvate,water dikinase